MDNNYKIVKCNEETKVCIIRDKYLNYGLSDKELNIILPAEYMNITFCKDGDTNIEIVKKDESGCPKYGRTDKFGKIIIPPMYSSIRSSNIKGKYNIDLNGRGLADMVTGQIYVKPGVYECIYELRNNQLSVESKEHKEGVLDTNYKLLIPAEYRQINLMNGDKYYRVNKLQGSEVIYGIIDTKGIFILPFEYSWIDEAGKIDAAGKPVYNYTVTKGNKNYTFNSLTGELK